MGEVADMMLDGTLCEGCGVVLKGDAYGVPRRCRDCDSHTGPPMAPGKVKCPQCGQHVKPNGLQDHQRARHAHQSEVKPPLGGM